MRLPSSLLPALALALGLGPPSTAAAAVEWLEEVVNGVGGVTGMSRATFAMTSPDGAFLYVAGRGDDSIVVFSRDLPFDGSLAFRGRATWTGSMLPGGTVPDLDRPTGIAIPPDGAHLYVTARRTSPAPSTIVVFARNLVTGALTYLGSLVEGSGGVTGIENAQSLYVSQDGANVYVPGFDANALIAFSRNPATGALAPLDIELDDVGGVDGLEAPQAVAESPDGAFLYLASQSRPAVRPGFGGISVFARDPVGALTFVELQQQGTGGVDGLWAPRDVALSPDGAHVYTANFGRGSEIPPKPGGLAVFARNALDGRLAFVDSYSDAELDVDNPTAVAVSPDGSTVYLSAQGLTAFFDGSLLVFSRDPATGLLTLVRRFDDNVAGIDGLAGAFAVHATADGQNVYVSSEQEPQSSELRGAVAVFTVPEPGAAALAAAAWLALGALRAAHPSGSSQSRGGRKSV
jgi:DNA-binding beta-propeller fold protein YncE